jgi:hypothetical protein
MTNWCGADMNLIDSKQVMAMAEFETDRAKAKLDNAIDAEAEREEMIAARTQEIVLQRTAEMKPIDVVAGLQSITEGAAAILRTHILAGDTAVVGVMVRSLVHLYIEQDSEVMAQEWMIKIDREIASWEH